MHGGGAREAYWSSSTVAARLYELSCIHIVLDVPEYLQQIYRDVCVLLNLCMGAAVHVRPPTSAISELDARHHSRKPSEHLIISPDFPNAPSFITSRDHTMSVAFLRLPRARAPCIRAFRSFSTTVPRFQPAVQSIPYTESCPSPTCACAPTPSDLDIDRKTPLLNTMAPYTEQVLLCTGKEDWASNLEDDEGATADFVKGLKGVIGKGGEAFDVCKPPASSRKQSCM